VGTVANRADGSVEVMARGTVHSMARLEVALREGPTMARVDRVEVVDCTLPDVVDTFSIEL
jgi:acylphosphatase